MKEHRSCTTIFFSGLADLRLGALLPVGGAFTTNIIRQRVGLSFTPPLFTNTYIQYNEAADFLSLNLRSTGFIARSPTCSSSSTRVGALRGSVICPKGIERPS